MLELKPRERDRDWGRRGGGGGRLEERGKGVCLCGRREAAVGDGDKGKRK